MESAAVHASAAICHSWVGVSIRGQSGVEQAFDVATRGQRTQRAVVIGGSELRERREVDMWEMGTRLRDWCCGTGRRLQAFSALVCQLILAQILGIETRLEADGHRPPPSGRGVKNE